MNFINIISSFLSPIYKKNTGSKVMPITDVMPGNKIIPLMDCQTGDIETGLLYGNPRDECRIYIHDYKWEECKWEECKWDV